MKVSITFLCLVLFSFSGLNAQVLSLQQTQLFPEDLPHKMTDFKVLGAKEQNGATEIYFSFKHPNGSIQNNLGGLSSQGADGVTLEGFGKVIINSEGAAVAAPVVWLGEPKLVGSSTYYAQTLQEDKYRKQEPLASKDEIIDKQVLRTLQRELSQLSKPEGITLDRPEEPVINYVEKYFKTLIYVGLSGGLSQIATVTYTLKPEEDWDKGLDPKPYSDKLSINKKGVDAAFGDSKISYKGFHNRKIYDPLSGNAVALGGLKYKKDKTKENSEYFEFRLLAFSQEGELFKSADLSSDTPLGMENVHPIYGKDLAPEVKEITHAVFVLKGDGGRKMEGIEPTLRRYILVDMKTGDILADNSFNLLHANSIPFELRQLASETVAIGYYYPLSGEEGFTYIHVNKNGNVTREEIDNDAYQSSGLSLPNDRYLRMKITTKQTFPLVDGGRVEVRRFSKESGSEANGDYRATTLQTAFFVYDREDNLLNIKKAAFGNQTKDATLIDQKDNVWKYLQVNGLGASKTIHFTALDLNALEINAINLPDGYYLADANSYYQDKEQSKIYFLSRGPEQKGLYFFSLQY